MTFDREHEKTRTRAHNIEHSIVEVIPLVKLSWSDILSQTFLVKHS